MKRTFTTVLWAFIYIIGANAQVNSTFNFLKLPVSSHAAALGGENISIIEDDLAMALQNPALLSCVADKTISLNYMFYMDGVGMGSAAFSKVINNRSAWAVGAQFLGYGKMQLTDAENNSYGTFSAKDIALMGVYNFDFNDYWSGGVTGKMVYSHYYDYTALGIGVDLGLNYYDSEHEWSVSLVAKNLGGQLKAYDDEYERMPLDVQAGVSKKFAALPFRVSATLVNLNNWDTSFKNHLVFGADIILSSQIYVALGYNFRRADEMATLKGTDNESTHMAGLSLGAGLQLERFKLQLAYGRYHVSSSSLLVNVSYSL